MTSPIIDPSRLTEELTHLATFTHEPPSPEGTAVTRIVFTPDDLAARAWLRSLAEQAGLLYRTDAVGNTFIRLEGTDPTLPAVATGSHIDAIPHAGMYDGTVGVLGGLEALRALKAIGPLPRSVELIVFTSEEPTRFGIGCLGSRLLAGTLAPGPADALVDTLDPGQTLLQARTEAGFPGDLASVQLSPGHYKVFFELHIEQGPILERAAGQIGLVSGIAAPAGYRFTLTGLGGHAGALLMPDRRDALCAASELILAVERAALSHGTLDTVATVGTCAVHPGAVNSVPGRVTLELDLRDTDPGRRERVMQAIREAAAEIAARRDIVFDEHLVNADEPAACAPAVLETLQSICDGQGFRSRTMVSRAYHDSLFMAQICPVGMIFIPCRGGVSHRPDEFAESADIARGASLLARALAKMASD